MSAGCHISRDGYGDLALWEGGTELLIRKCDLPPATRDRVWDVLVEALDAEEVQPCAAVTWRGNAWGPNPEPDELCENDALPGEEFCDRHLDPEDC